MAKRHEEHHSIDESPPDPGTATPPTQQEEKDHLIASLRGALLQRDREVEHLRRDLSTATAARDESAILETEGRGRPSLEDMRLLVSDLTPEETQILLELLSKKIGAKGKVATGKWIVTRQIFHLFPGELKPRLVPPSAEPIDLDEAAAKDFLKNGAIEAHCI